MKELRGKKPGEKPKRVPEFEDRGEDMARHCKR